MTSGKAGVHVIQMRVGWDPLENADRIAELLEGARPGDIVVTPEGSVSGYPPTGDAADLSRIESRKVSEALDALEFTAKTKGVVLWVGVVRQVGDPWCNEAVELTSGEHRTYRKCNLADWERNVFTPGTSLPTFDVGSARIGVQICRELRFAEQWIGLALTGAPGPGPPEPRGRRTQDVRCLAIDARVTRTRDTALGRQRERRSS